MGQQALDPVPQRIPGQDSEYTFPREWCPRAKVQLVQCAEFVSVGVFLGKNACRARRLTLQ